MEVRFCLFFVRCSTVVVCFLLQFSFVALYSVCRRTQTSLAKQHAELMQVNRELQQTLTRQQQLASEQQQLASEEQGRLKQRCEENDQRIKRMQEQRDQGIELHLLREYGRLNGCPHPALYSGQPTQQRTQMMLPKAGASGAFIAPGRLLKIEDISDEEGVPGHTMEQTAAAPIVAAVASEGLDQDQNAPSASTSLTHVPPAPHPVGTNADQHAGDGSSSSYDSESEAAADPPAIESPRHSDSESASNGF